MTEAAYEISGTADPNAICPTSGEVCSARAEVIALYSEDVQPEVEQHLPYENRAHMDRVKMNVKLAELTARAIASECEGMDGELCPVREAMNESAVRSTAVKGIRRFLGKIK